MMQHRLFLSRFLCISCASFALVGCSYFDTADNTGLRVDTTYHDVAQDIAVYDEGSYSLSPRPVDLSHVVYESTGGSVEVYDLDALTVDRGQDQTSQFEVEPLTAAPVEPAYSRVTVFSADPSVEIFAFDDDAIVSEPLYGNVSEVFGELPDGKVVVYFDHDSAILNAQALNKVSHVARAFNAASGAPLTVEGHASVRANYRDASQREAVNLRVSMQRALAVAGDLIDQGVPGEMIHVVAWGDAVPPAILDGKTPEEAARRVEISR